MWKWVRKFMTRELGWSRPNERDLNNVAKELEKCVATDTTQIYLKMLRKQWTVKELYRRNLSLFTLYCKMSGIFTLLFLPLVIHLPLFSLKHFFLTSSSLITVSLFFQSESMINMPGNAWCRLLATAPHLFWLQKLLLILTFLCLFPPNEHKPLWKLWN